LYPINSIRALNGGCVAGKPEGLFTYDESRGKYVNRMKYDFAAHADNGKGMFAGKDCVFYPTADGSLFKYDGSSLEDIGPKHSCQKHRDAPYLQAPITAGCVVGDWVYVATKPGENGWTKGHGLKVITFDASTGSYNDITTNCVDGDLATGGSVAGLSIASGTDFIYVGADIPFEAVHFTPGVANTTAGNLGVVAISSSYSTTGWISNGSSAAPLDSTMNGTATLAAPGYRRLLRISDYGTHNLFTKATVNETSKYWARFTVSSDVGLLAGSTIAEVRILPSRPPIKAGTITAGNPPTVTNGNFDYTGPDAAGIFPHILAGHVGASGNWEWFDLFCLQASAPVAAMAYMEADTKQAEGNVGPRLFMLTRHHLHTAMFGWSDNPGSPVNENYADGVSLGTPIVYFNPTDLSDGDTDRRTTVNEVDAFHIYGEYVDGSDTLTMFQREDHNAWDVVGTANNAPSVMSGGRGQHGLILETALAYEDVDVEVAGPRITSVDVDFHDTDIVPEPQADQATVALE